MLRITVPVSSVVAGAFVSIAAAASLDVLAVAPSGPTVPERLLRISVVLAAPAEQFRAQLVRKDGSVIEGALLDQQLWSSDRKTATLLFDPARVKTGLIAHEAAGWALIPGQQVTLRINSRPVRTWEVVPGGCLAPNPAKWVIAAPPAGTRAPLALAFPDAIDALSRDLIDVADANGQRVSGSARLVEGERRWMFVPAATWGPGAYDVVVSSRLESPCGDEPGEAFEHPAGQGLGSQRTERHERFEIR